MKTKICSNPECRKEKPVTEFYKDISAKDGLTSWCKDCRKKISKKYIQNNREKRNNQKKEYYQKNKEEILEYWQKSIGRYSRYKAGSKEKNRNFDLTLEQFEEITSQPCYYCGKFTKDKEFCGVDRIDNSKGYTPKNCVPCCEWCNLMKHKKSHNEFLNHVRDIYTHSFRDLYEVWEENK